jgi:hypothetical protein
MTNYTELKRLAEDSKAFAAAGFPVTDVADTYPPELFHAGANEDVVLSMIAEIDTLRTQNQALLEAQPVAQVNQCEQQAPYIGHDCDPALADAAKVICPACCTRFRAIPVDVQLQNQALLVALKRIEQFNDYECAGPAAATARVAIKLAEGKGV